MSDEDRADRLRRRRQRARDRAQTDESTATDETAKTAKPDETDERDEGDERGKTDETGETGERGETTETDEPKPSVKDEQKPTYMYLPHTVRRDLDRSYSMLKAEYEYEYQEAFEKNRHFYPLVVSLGLEAIDGLDPDEVRSRLEDGL